jgi:hypothetical protein
MHKTFSVWLKFARCIKKMSPYAQHYHFELNNNLCDSCKKNKKINKIISQALTHSYIKWNVVECNFNKKKITGFQQFCKTCCSERIVRLNFKWVECIQRKPYLIVALIYKRNDWVKGKTAQSIGLKQYLCIYYWDLSILTAYFNDGCNWSFARYNKILQN